MQKLNAMAFALSAAILSAVMMLLLSIASALGLYENAAGAMMQWHMFYDLSAMGTIAGMIEAAVFSFIACYVFVSLYNYLLPRKK